MSQGINRAHLAGNVGEDPQLRYTQNNNCVLNVRLCTPHSYVVDGEQKDSQEWHTVVVWGKKAEALGKMLNKGDPFECVGHIRTRVWEGKEGQRNKATEIVADDILVPRLERQAKSSEQTNYGKPPEDQAPDDGFGTDDIPF